MKLKFAIIIFSMLTLTIFFGLAFKLIRTSDLLDKGAKNLSRASESVQVAKEIKNRLLTHSRNAFLYSLHKDPARLESRRSQRIEIQKLLAEAEKNINAGEGINLLNDVRTELADYFAKQDQLKLSTSSPVEQYDQTSQDVDDALAVIDKFVHLNRSQMSEILQSANAQNKTAIQMAIGFFIFGGMVILGIIGAVIFGIGRPLYNLAAVVHEYGVGKSAVRAKAEGVREVKIVASNFNCMADSLSERHKDQLRFIAAIAHDLRNPLNSISMASELLMGRSEKKEQEISKIIFQQVKHLDRLVGDLLDTSRIEAGELELQKNTLDINLLVKDAVNLHRGTSDLHVITVETQKDPLICNCDSGRILQVMNNLISNAIKYSPNGGIITVKLAKKGTQACITVEDKGIGIAPQDIDNIFKPFHRTKVTKETIPGVGLGLSTSRRIIEAHGGQLTAKSTLGEGSTFQIILPASSNMEVHNPSFTYSASANV